MTGRTVVDLFAGPGGWDVAAKFRQIGNAVPPLLAEHIIRAATS